MSGTKVIFVYGTLLKGETNHQAYLSQSTYLGKAVLRGYALYNLGAFPGIKLSSGDCVKGEIYEVSGDTLKLINRLEGEGSLYRLEKVKVTDAENISSDALTYIYKHDIKEENKIPVEYQPWGRYIWYACYGSNTLYKRFMCYIQGGQFTGNKRNIAPCEDTTPPLASMPLEIPYDMYFGNPSSSWGDGGVSFLDAGRPGKALGRMFLITKQQMEHVHSKESKSENWYDKVVCLGKKDGIPVITITNHTIRPRCKPNDQYFAVVLEGLWETYPEKSDAELRDYISTR